MTFRRRKVSMVQQHFQRLRGYASVDQSLGESSPQAMSASVFLFAVGSLARLDDDDSLSFTNQAIILPTRSLVSLSMERLAARVDRMAVGGLSSSIRLSGRLLVLT